MATPLRLQYYFDRLEAMRTERASFIPHWRDLSEHLLPRQSRFLVTDRNRGEKRNNKIINETGTLALRILSSGMMSGMTNPARPWIALRTPDPDLNDFKRVKVWLETFRNRMLELMIRSNIYSIFPMSYRDQGCYGTTAYAHLQDDQDLFRGYHFPMGSFMLALNDRGRVDTCYREFEMTPRQLVGKFGKENCSREVQRLATEASTKESWVTVVHAQEPNEDYTPSKNIVSRYKKYKSCYFEKGTNEDKFLRFMGKDQFDILAPRWDVTGEDVYGSAPGMDVLGTVRQLQLREKRKSQLIDKGTNPPMGAPSGMRKKKSSVLPGDVTYYEQTGTGQKFEPLYQPDPAFYQWVLQDIDACSQRVRKAFFEDLFLMMANDYRSNITAREIAERHEEKLLQLGPVILRQNDEHYDPLVELQAGYMFKANVIPPPPPELHGQPLMVEYISVLSQAMKMVGVTGIEKLTGYLGTIAAVKPNALDNFDEDKAVIEYAKIVGAPAVLIKDPEEVARDRAARQARQQLMQMASAAPVMADTAKTLSETKTGNGENALTQMQRGVQQQ